MNLIERLDKSSVLKTENDFKEFTSILQEMAKSKNKIYIHTMLSYLDDNCIFSDAMNVIIGMAETFSNEDYISGVVDLIPALKQKAPGWLDIIHNGIMGSKKCIEIYKGVLSRKQSIDNDVEEYLICYKKRYNKYAEIVDYITG